MTTTKEQSNRFMQLAWAKEPKPEEAGLIEVAKIIDPDAWRCRPYLDRRYRSIQAAERVAIHYAVTSMEVWQEPQPKPLALTSRFAALFRVLPIHRRARAS